MIYIEVFMACMNCKFKSWGQKWVLILNFVSMFMASWISKVYIKI